MMYPVHTSRQIRPGPNALPALNQSGPPDPVENLVLKVWDEEVIKHDFDGEHRWYDAIVAASERTGLSERRIHQILDKYRHEGNKRGEYDHYDLPKENR